MTDIDSKRQALATLDSRLAAGEISGDEYERLRTLLTSGLTPDQCARLGVTSSPAPRTTSGISIGPSGGQTRMPTLAELELAPGTVLLDQWRIVRELGRGGFGAVFEADDIKLDRKLAVKVLDPTMAARKELLARFRREVTLMRELSHERIVRVFDYREEASENLALITMEYVDGCSVRDLLALARASKETISVELALAIFEQTLEALAAAHARGVIHRDVTPGNILLAGGRAAELLSDPDLDPRIKLVDFGIAGLVERSELSAKSRVLGTAAYVGPEVLDPDAEITPEADVFGAGAVAYEMLTGKTPVVTGYRPVEELRDNLPTFFAEVVSMAVLPVPRERPSSVEALEALTGSRAQQTAASRKQKELLGFHARISHSVRDEDEADLKDACRELRELLGPKADFDEHLASGEKWLELWEGEKWKRDKGEGPVTRSENAQVRHSAATEGVDGPRRQLPNAEQSLASVDRLVQATAPVSAARPHGQPKLSSPARWVLRVVAGLVVIAAVTLSIVRDSDSDGENGTASSTTSRYWAIAIDEGCKPQGAESSFDVERVMNRVMGTQLDLLSVERKSGPQCWLLVWGQFNSREAAADAVDEVPIQYTKNFFRPHVVEVMDSRVIP